MGMNLYDPKEARNQMAKECDLNICKGQSEFDATMDFRDTAAVLANCDLLISADSSVVHLAGGMGIPVWVLIRTEWRWGTEGKIVLVSKCKII